MIDKRYHSARLSLKRLFTWWYFAIAAGFALLALNRWIVARQWGAVLLRLVIALGFLALGFVSRRDTKKR